MKFCPHVAERPEKVVRFARSRGRRVGDPDWRISLGMHNFREVERVEGSLRKGPSPPIISTKQLPMGRGVAVRTLFGDFIPGRARGSFTSCMVVRNPKKRHDRNLKGVDQAWIEETLADGLFTLNEQSSLLVDLHLAREMLPGGSLYSGSSIELGIPSESYILYDDVVRRYKRCLRKQRRKDKKSGLHQRFETSSEESLPVASGSEVILDDVEDKPLQKATYTYLDETGASPAMVRNEPVDDANKLIAKSQENPPLPVKEPDVEEEVENPIIHPELIEKRCTFTVQKAVFGAVEVLRRQLHDRNWDGYWKVYDESCDVGFTNEEMEDAYWDGS